MKESLSALPYRPLALLDWYVSDANIEDIGRIFRSSSDGDKQAIRNAIGPRATDLNFGQRERLRIILL